MVAHRAQQPLEGLHGGSRRGQSTRSEPLQALVVFLANVRLDVGRKARFHHLARHRDFPMGRAQRVLGLGPFVVGFHQYAAVFRGNGLQHQKVQALFLLDGAVRTLNDVPIFRRQRKAKLGVWVVRFLDRVAVERCVLSQLVQLFDALVQASKIGLEGLWVELWHGLATFSVGGFYGR